MKELEKVTDDLRFRIAEHENRPRALAELLSSLNLTNVFKRQLKNMPEANEIYSEKDVKDLEKVADEVTVSKHHLIVFVGDSDRFHSKEYYISILIISV